MILLAFKIINIFRKIFENLKYILIVYINKLQNKKDIICFLMFD